MTLKLLFLSKLDIRPNNKYNVHNYSFATSNDKTDFIITKTNTGFFDGYYDSTTDIYWLIRNANGNLYLYKKNVEGASEEEYNIGITQNSFGDCAIRGENLYYSFYSDYGDSIGYATFDYTSGTAEVKAKKTLSDFKTLSGFDGSGEINDIAVLEDGRVAIIVRDTNTSSTNDNTTKTVIYNYTVTDGGTVYSRGALLILSSDLSKVEKVLGWSGERTISATGSSSDYNVQWDKITAYIPEYEDRNSHFYGPVKIVAIRPKELVIADCGANFVLPDYNEKKNGKMFTHNRLMTVDLRNFAISCKKEFTEDEIKFQNLAVSGNLTVTSSGTTDSIDSSKTWSDGVEK